MPHRIGIFGGTFDPPHLGHMILASEALQQLKLTRLLWMLTPMPPHKQKQQITSVAHRLEMVQAAIRDVPRFELSTLEFERPAPQYTADTLRILQEHNPSSDLILLLGADSLRSITTWYHPAEIVASCREIGVMQRPGELIQMGVLEAALPKLKEKVRFVETPLLQISSREIRRRIAEGMEYRYFLTPVVYDYIQANHLYGI
ncbi:MAG: Nicotinate-nucleotide adenylyltransferase [Anaerolineales bacterium]|nr:Nicotinate-nucleotide adenylyltransferase [Anaerolineales bacterium]